MELSSDTYMEPAELGAPIADATVDLPAKQRCKAKALAVIQANPNKLDREVRTDSVVVPSHWPRPMDAMAVGVS